MEEEPSRHAREETLISFLSIFLCLSVSFSMIPSYRSLSLPGTLCSIAKQVDRKDCAPVNVRNPGGWLRRDDTDIKEKKKRREHRAGA